MVGLDGAGGRGLGETAAQEVTVLEDPRRRARTVVGSADPRATEEDLVLGELPGHVQRDGVDHGVRPLRLGARIVRPDGSTRNQRSRELR